MVMLVVFVVLLDTVGLPRTGARPLHPPPPVDGMLQKRTDFARTTDASKLHTTISGVVSYTPSDYNYKRLSLTYDNRQFLGHRKVYEQLIGQLSHYELVIPTLVNRKGEFLSYKLEAPDEEEERAPQTTHRKKRYVHHRTGSADFQPHSVWQDRVFYKLSAYGHDFKFNLTLNRKLVSRKFVVEYWGSDGVKKRHYNMHRCHFVGYSSEPYKSETALSNCHGLQGVFTTEDEDYFVEPLWNHTNNVEREGYPHIVYKRSALKLPGDTPHCGVKDNVSNKDGVWHSNAQQSGHGTLKEQGHNGRRKKRSVSREQNVETLVVADRMMLSYHGLHEIEPYILTIMNIVAKLYHDVSIGNAVNIIVTRLVLLTDEQPNLVINHHADRSLGSFCRWQKMINSPIAYNSSDETIGIAHHDNAVLMTRYDICTYKNKPCATLGLAPVAGMCEDERSCSINEDIGLASAYTIAHEIGHNFGMQHDGAGNTCGTPGHEGAKIMAAQLTKGTTPFLWSSCSSEYITDFLDSRRGYCLENAPVEKDFEFPEELPGKHHNVDQQCKLQFYSKSTGCKPLEVCRQLWCLNSSGKCVTNGIPAADGTQCQIARRRKKGYCYRGQCVKGEFKPKSVDGGWSEWTSWSNCSRMCNGGVEASEKHCNNPKPKDRGRHCIGKRKCYQSCNTQFSEESDLCQKEFLKLPKHGGRYCIGKRKRYRSCNTHDCPADEVDFREIQCDSYNSVPFRGRYYKWKPFTGSHVKPCTLNCLAEGYNFYTERAPKVIDGTRCFPDKLDICINGECWHVGCDHVLGSTAKEDKCRVCGGDGSSCKTIAGVFDQPLFKGADYHEVVRIPQGAMNIRVAEKVATKNYLALKNEGSIYYINGGWTIDWPRKFAVGGTIVHYDRPTDEPESFYALGPIRENFVVMILLQEENPGITYEYTLPFNDSSHDVSKYNWKHMEWTECSKSCGKGQSVSTPICQLEEDGSPVNEALCSPQPKPGQLNRWCNRQPCPPMWLTGNWSACTQTCGSGGIRRRTVMCVQVIDDHERVILEERDCMGTGTKPGVEETCNNHACPTVWVGQEWSECTPSCGNRRRKTRQVYCLGSNSRTYVDEGQCDPSTKPPSQAWCESTSCEGAKWDTGPWGVCTVTCGSGEQHRTVKCRTSTGVPSDLCPPSAKPPSKQECGAACPQEEREKEEPEEYTEECVDKYHVAYCPLVVQSRFCSRSPPPKSFV